MSLDGIEEKSLSARSPPPKNWRTAVVNSPAYAGDTVVLPATSVAVSDMPSIGSPPSRGCTRLPKQRVRAIGQLQCVKRGRVIH